MSDAGSPTYTCPFCAAQTPGPFCPNCGRDRTAPRQVCRACGGLTPKSEPDCSHCGARQVNELVRKVPLIVVIFAVAIALSVALRLFLD